MPSTDLTRARRRLAQLKSRYQIMHSLSPWIDTRLLPEARRMARELEREIKEQELECRRLALTGPWVVKESAEPGTWYVLTGDGRLKWSNGHNAKARAVAWAERQNRKAGGK